MDKNEIAFTEWYFHSHETGNNLTPLQRQREYEICFKAWNAEKKAHFTSNNKKMVTALWKALSDIEVMKAVNHRGAWLPLTKSRLSAAYTKVCGLYFPET